MDRYGLTEKEADFFISLPDLILLLALPLFGLFVNSCGLQG